MLELKSTITETKTHWRDITADLSRQRISELKKTEKMKLSLKRKKKEERKANEHKGPGGHH